MDRDDILNVSKALVAWIPGVWWSMASLMWDYIPTKKDERLKNALEDIWTRLGSVEDKYIKLIETDWFAFLMDRWLKWIRDYYQEIKVWCFKWIIINWLLKDSVSQQEKEYYLYLTENLWELHLRLLSFLYEPAQYCEKYNIDIWDKRFDNWDWRQVMMAWFPSFDLDVVYWARSDLYKMSILKNDKPGNIMMATSGLALVRMDNISSLGKKFISFCIEY